MRELQLAWNIMSLTLVVDLLMGSLTGSTWQSFVIRCAAALVLAILLEQPRRRAFYAHNRRLAAEVE